MYYKSIYRAVCLCALLLTSGANATTVWSIDLINDQTSSQWRMYIVTAEDQISVVMSPTGVYVDSLAHAMINPIDLLTQDPVDVAKESLDTFDIYSHVRSPNFMVTFPSLPGDKPILDSLYVSQYDQDIVRLRGDIDCFWRFLLGCVYGGQYADPISLFVADEVEMKGPVLTLAASTVPLPSSLWLIGSGLLGLIGVARRKARA